MGGKSNAVARTDRSGGLELSGESDPSIDGGASERGTL
jgi:hypothetical protein